MDSTQLRGTQSNQIQNKLDKSIDKNRFNERK